MPMNPEIKAAWLDALRSGNYNQAAGYLHTQDGYCCLGVLTKIAVDTDPEIARRIRFLEDATEMLDDDDQWVSPDSEDLPEDVRTWAGLDDANPRVKYRDTVYPISNLNDGLYSDRAEREPMPFSVIADLIEEQL